MPRKRVTAPPRPLDLTSKPDSAHIPTHEVARLTGYTKAYIRKKVKTDETFPKPVARSGTRGPLWWIIGDVRAYLKRRGEERK